jgi:hypothetical protein
MSLAEAACLLPTPDADLLFDRGFITFENDGDVCVSPRMDRLDLKRLGLEVTECERRLGFDDAAAWQPCALTRRQWEYMAYHREQVFVS